GLAGLAVADEQLALAASDGDHGVDGLDAGLARLLHRLALDHARRLELDVAELVGADRPLAVHRLANRVHDAPDHGGAHGHRGDAAGQLDAIAFLDVLVGAEQHRADVVLFEVQDQAHDVAGEADQLAGHRVLEPPDAGDAVADGQHAADALGLELGLVSFEFLRQDGAHFFRSKGHWRRVLVRSVDDRAARARAPSLGASLHAHFVKLLAYRFEQRPDAAIDDPVSDAHVRAAHERGVQLGLEHDVLAREPLQLRMQALALGFLEPHGPPHHGTLEPLGAPDDPLVLVRDGLDHRHALLAQQQVAEHAHG